jgi:lysophospholipase L1-like esterase
MLKRSCVLAAIVATVVCGTWPTVCARAASENEHWIGTWATAPQPPRPGEPPTYRNQTLRLIVHTSVGGSKVRVRLSNVYGSLPMSIGGAHIARRAAAAEIDPVSDRVLRFGGHPNAVVAPGSLLVSDPVDLDVPALSDLAISVFFPESVAETTSHVLALQTSYVSSEPGDSSAAASFPVGKTIATWPFLTGVDVRASARGASIVAFGSSTTDGDGSTKDANRRWPDILAEQVQRKGAGAAGSELGVLNLGIIGNRLLHDSPDVPNSPFGRLLGEAGLRRFARDVLSQPGVKFVFVALGVNDILFPAYPFTPGSEMVTPAGIIAGYRQLIARAHENGIRVIGTTIPPFEGATFVSATLNLKLYTPERDKARRTVNDWILHGGQFDAAIDFDRAVRDPDRPSRLLPAYAAKDHLHVNDAGNAAQAGAVPLALFDRY